VKALSPPPLRHQHAYRPPTKEKTLARGSEMQPLVVTGTAPLVAVRWPANPREGCRRLSSRPP
jgi:hypothetical protein